MFTCPRSALAQQLVMLTRYGFSLKYFLDDTCGYCPYLQVPATAGTCRYGYDGYRTKIEYLRCGYG